MKRNRELEVNCLVTPPADFIDSYNHSIPVGFPRATAVRLKEFQATHPLLFKKGDGWSIDKHRKRLMDWLSSNF